MPAEAATVPIGDEHAAEAGGVEHRGEADVAGADLHACPFGIDRVRLDAWSAGRLGGGHDPVEQGARDAPASR